jgi:hypothetical protein
MICYEVWVNGERACVAGAKKMKSLHASLIFPKQTSQALFMVGAETEPTESLKESANWIGRELNINDEIKIKIIESETPDKPESIKSFGTKIGSKGEKLVYCSFCGQSEKEAERIVAGFQANVCSECFKLLADIFNEKA